MRIHADNVGSAVPIADFLLFGYLRISVSREVDQIHFFIDIVKAEIVCVFPGVAGYSGVRFSGSYSALIRDDFTDVGFALQTRSPGVSFSGRLAGDPTHGLQVDISDYHTISSCTVYHLLTCVRRSSGNRYPQMPLRSTSSMCVTGIVWPVRSVNLG